MRAQIRFTEKPHLKIIIFMEKQEYLCWDKGLKGNL